MAKAPTTTDGDKVKRNLGPKKIFLAYKLGMNERGEPELSNVQAFSNGADFIDAITSDRDLKHVKVTVKAGKKNGAA